MQLLNTFHNLRQEIRQSTFNEIERELGEVAHDHLNRLRDVGVETFQVPWRSLAEYHNTVRAQQEVHFWAGRFIKNISGPLRNPREIDREDILIILLNEIMLGLDVCAGITLSRVNAYKHLTYGVSDRYDFVYPVEWIIAAKALRWVGDLFRVMIATTTLNR